MKGKQTKEKKRSTKQTDKHKEEAETRGGKQKN